ncbi:hypothetical protein [Archangium lipolyticum]|uniref:hypothetical protein n=1 Tax=Archangium lipolyticum TaxID=2970465 RepID=UPI00214A5954|nr:hypothetical protein [Archangium lipolyticum]
MPVALLFVEGDLDAEVLTALLVTPPLRVAVTKGGPKGSLPPKARDERKKNVRACYLRDRDFDFDPPANLGHPTVDRIADSSGNVLGWRWCRHELESYLLEPRLVSLATGWDEASYSAELMKAAKHLQSYTAARWAVGIARRSMPPTAELPTRPDTLQNEIKLPSDCGEAACFNWARDHIEAFRQKVEPALASMTIAASLAERSRRLAAQTSIEDVLVWHSGKDLLAALEPAISRRPENNPVVFRRRLRDWVRNNPAAAVAIFPEWRALLDQLSA